MAWEDQSHPEMTSVAPKDLSWYQDIEREAKEEGRVQADIEYLECGSQEAVSITGSLQREKGLITLPSQPTGRLSRKVG